MDVKLQEKVRVDWVDTLRAFAVVGVVLVHASGGGLSVPGTVGAMEWWAPNLGNAAGRCAVPVFLMLSGALLLPRVEPIRELLWRRLGKLFWPFLVWSLAYGCHAFLTQAHPPEGPVAVGRWIASRAVHGTAYHLWYIYVLFGMYLAVPFLGILARQATDKQLQCFLAVWAATLVFNLPGLSAYTLKVDLSFFSGYAGYLMLGYYMQRRLSQVEPTRGHVALGAALAVAGLALTAGGAYAWMRHRGEVSDVLYDPLTLNVLLYTVGIFLIGWGVRWRAAWVKTSCAFLARNSYGIYLAHVAVLMLCGQLRFLADQPAALGIPLLTVFCLAATALLVVLLRRLPLGKYVVG